MPGRAKAASSTERVYADLKRIITAELRPGDRLPTTRSLVTRYQVSPITVQHALTRLT